MKSIITLLSVLAITASVHAADDAKGKGKGADPEKVFAKLDSNSDGKISKEEFMAGPAAKKDAAKAEESFGKKDKNKDGSLTKEEMAPVKQPK